MLGAIRQPGRTTATTLPSADCATTHPSAAEQDHPFRPMDGFDLGSSACPFAAAPRKTRPHRLRLRKDRGSPPVRDRTPPPARQIGRELDQHSRLCTTSPGGMLLTQLWGRFGRSDQVPGPSRPGVPTICPRCRADHVSSYLVIFTWPGDRISWGTSESFPLAADDPSSPEQPRTLHPAPPQSAPGPLPGRFCVSILIFETGARVNRFHVLLIVACCTAASYVLQPRP